MMVMAVLMVVSSLYIKQNQLKGQNWIKQYLPIDSLNYKIIDYTGYSVAFDEANCITHYSIYLLTKNELMTKQIERMRNFTNEQECDCNRNTNYTNTGYDRGHLTPFADKSYTNNTAYESMSMCNIVPMTVIVNRKYWLQIENEVRKTCLRIDSLIVITGTVEAAANMLQSSGLSRKLYKLIYSLKEKKFTIWICNNSRLESDIDMRMISLAEWKKYTKMKLNNNYKQ